MFRLRKCDRLGILMIGGLLSACAPNNQDIALVEGPAIIDVVTPFDDALACLDGRIDKRLGFAVGNIPDSTGRESFNGEGAGRYVTQAAGDMVQSALFKTGVKVINRRDMGSAALEAQWGIRSMESQNVSHFAITGSINSLDFLPGGGVLVNVGGVGARYTQNRALVGLDLAMTNVSTGQVISNISLKKQMVVNDAGLFGSGFDNGNVIDSDIGGARREALNDALRAMLQLATLELLLQLMPPDEYADCVALVDPRFGTIAGQKTAGEQFIAYRDAQRDADLRAAQPVPASTEPPPPPPTELPSSAAFSTLPVAGPAEPPAMANLDAAAPAVPIN